MKIFDKEKIAKEFFEKLKQELSIPAYESWIKPLKIHSIDNEKFVISTNSNLGKELIYKNYVNLIKKIIYEITGQHLDFKVKVVETKNIKIDEKINTKKPEQTPINKSVSITESQIDSLKSLSNNLNLKYTFDTFVVGPHNKFCHAAAFAVSKFPELGIS